MTGDIVCRNVRSIYEMSVTDYSNGVWIGNMSFETEEVGE